MEFKLKNPELVELDKQIFELNKSYSMAFNSLNRFPNIYGVEDFLKKSTEIKEKLGKIKTSDEFEKIFVENSLANLESQETYLVYFSKGGIEIDKMVESVLGAEALDILKKNMKEFDYEKFWEYYLSHKEYVYRGIPADDESLRDKFKEILVDLKKDFLEYSKENYGLPEDYDFELVLGQPYSNENSFHPTNMRMELAPSTFFVFKDEGETKINLAEVIRVLFHEILGHGRHEVLSRNMPLSMQDNSINTTITSLHIHFEGVSKLAEEKTVEFMEAFKEKYKIEEDYISQFVLSKASDGTISFMTYYQYLGLKDIAEGSSDRDSEFTKLTGNQGLTVLYSSQKNSPLGFAHNASYPLGFFYLDNLLGEIKEKLGPDKFNENFTEINKAIATGVFNYKILPGFVRLYLKDKGILK
ncbi:MAG: hypothetical protein Q8P81_02440 [Nanoarchaeota archaeon]|nr:hypothetical protein [Nanoarchaeota archaeon]